MNDMDRQEQIEFMLDHYQNPHNHGEMADADASFQGGNPGCGDIVTMYVKMDGDHIEEVSFTGEGCTISQAAASVLTDELKGMTMAEVEQLGYPFISNLLGDEVVKMRPRCATVALDAAKTALKEYRRKKILGE